jgi:hypothetical protein
MYVNAKITPVEISRNWGEGLKESNGGGQFKHNIFGTL